MPAVSDAAIKAHTVAAHLFQHGNRPYGPLCAYSASHIHGEDTVALSRLSLGLLVNGKNKVNTDDVVVDWARCNPAAQVVILTVCAIQAEI